MPAPEAPPGSFVAQILVSSRVAGALEGLVEVEEVGPLTLKGFLRPIPTFSLLGLK